jgi:hypothetical protein
VDDYDFFATSPAAQPAPVPAWGAPAGPVGTAPAVTLSPEEQQMLSASTATSWSNMTGTPSSYSPSGRLGFMNSIRVGFQLLPLCWSVLAQQPSLLFVPLIVLVAGALAVFGYADAFGGAANLLGPNKYAAAIKVFPLLAVVVSMSVVGQAVIVAAATDSLQGHRTTLSGAWVTAGSQLPRLVLFGVVYAAERTITSLLRGRRWSLGSIAAGTIDRAWDFATFLAIPVLLYENLPVFRAVARSGKLVASRWGVQLTARAVLNVALFIVVLPLIIVGVVLSSVSAVLGAVVLVAAVLGMFAASGALTGVLSAALYRFGTTGQVAPGFSEADMWAVFSRR